MTAAGSRLILCDQWAADHIFNWAPYLARNVVLTSEKDPWLRKKLEAMATGEEGVMRIVAYIGLGGAVFMYVAPLAIKWFDLPVGDQARAMLGVPVKDPLYAQGPAAAAA